MFPPSKPQRNRTNAGETALLLDETMAALASSDHRFINVTPTDISDPHIHLPLIEQILSSGHSGTTVLETSFTVNGLPHLRIVSVEPVKVMGKQWSLLISPLADVEEVVQGAFFACCLVGGLRGDLGDGDSGLHVATAHPRPHAARASAA